MINLEAKCLNDKVKCFFMTPFTWHVFNPFVFKEGWASNMTWFLQIKQIL